MSEVKKSGAKKRTHELLEDAAYKYPDCKGYLWQFDFSYLDEVFKFIEENYKVEERVTTHRHNSRRYGAVGIGSPIIYRADYQTSFLDINFYIDVSSAMFVEHRKLSGSAKSLGGGIMDRPNAILTELICRLKKFECGNVNFIPFCETVFSPLNVDTELFAQQEGEANIELVQRHIVYKTGESISVIITNSKLTIDRQVVPCNNKVVYIVGHNTVIDDSPRIFCKVIKLDSLLSER